jgi:DNA repair exonuclease SbcCD ATPase subunit
MTEHKHCNCWRCCDCGTPRGEKASAVELEALQEIAIATGNDLSVHPESIVGQLQKRVRELENARVTSAEMSALENTIRTLSSSGEVLAEANALIFDGYEKRIAELEAENAKLRLNQQRLPAACGYNHHPDCDCKGEGGDR